jgi:2-keto-3-deoxy-L-rhamnonate aldolase RhmA
VFGKFTPIVAVLVAALGAAVPSKAQQAAQVLVNTGPIDPNTWIRGSLYAAPTTPSIWNPVKLAASERLRIAFATQSAFNLQAYCTQATKVAAEADAKDIVYPTTWTETQHSPLDHTQIWAMWDQPCAFKPVPAAGVFSADAEVPGMRPATLLKRDLQKGLDGGAMVFMVPTVDTVEQAKDIIDQVFYPPIGKRLYGPSQADKLYANVPGGYRETFNDNVVLVFMIETILGSQEAREIGKLPQVFALFAAASDLGNFAGYANGDADYEKVIRNAYLAAKAGGKLSCSSFANRTRVNQIAAVPPAPFTYNFDCFQN